MFKITDHKGFEMSFENGLTISVQFGSSNYCDNRSYSTERPERTQNIYSCANAEVAIWDKNDKWVTGQLTDDGDGTVAGWLSTEKVADLIYKVKNYKS